MKTAKQQPQEPTQGEQTFYGALANTDRVYTTHFTEAFYGVLVLSDNQLARQARQKMSWKDHLMYKVARDVLKLDDGVICVEQQEFRYNYRFSDAYNQTVIEGGNNDDNAKNWDNF